MPSLRALVLLGCLAAALCACDRGSDAKPAPAPSSPAAAGTTSPAARTGDPRTEPYEVMVQHVLYAYRGAARSRANRTKEQAYALAKSAIEDLKKGRAIEEVMAFTDDAGADGRPNATADGPGVYRVTRSAAMAPRFIAGAFATPLGEVAAEPVETEFGYHVMKRLK